jgi:aspartyl-tRNA(Asn)/glutamyl-tRNA(Gln) amidotransferase subunit A
MASTPRTIAGAQADLRARRVTATELIEESITRADAVDDAVGVYIHRFDDNARAAAAEVDSRIARGDELRPLDGIPIGMKDILADSQGPTTAQSLVLDQAWSETAGDAVVVRRLKEAGAIITGKLTTMEFAIGTPDPSKPFPIPRNAWDQELWAGGSSSGSASGVASGVFLGAIGTDTAGSIRIPAAFNGVTGLKATFGRVPKSGVVPLAYTLDHIGPLTRSTRDAAIMLQAIAGADPSDPYTSDVPVEDYVAAVGRGVAGMRIGVDTFEPYASGGVDRAQPGLFADALRTLEGAGATIVDVTMPRYAELTAVALLVMIAEGYTYHHNDIWSRWDDYGQSTRILFAAGEAISSAAYVQAQRVRRVAQAEADAVLRSVDAVITPTGHLGAPRLDGMSMLNPMAAMASLHTPYWNPLGVPTLAVPIGLSATGAPLSMTISAPAWGESTVLAVGDAYQQLTEFHLAETPLVQSLAQQPA